MGQSALLHPPCASVSQTSQELPSFLQHMFCVQATYFLTLIAFCILTTTAANCHSCAPASLHKHMQNCPSPSPSKDPTGSPVLNQDKLQTSQSRALAAIAWILPVFVDSWPSQLSQSTGSQGREWGLKRKRQFKNIIAWLYCADFWSMPIWFSALPHCLLWCFPFVSNFINMDLSFPFFFCLFD